MKLIFPLQFILFICLILPQSIFAQIDTNKRYERINWTGINAPLPQQKMTIKSIVPIAFCTAALAINDSTFKTNLQTKILAPFNGFTTTADDYIQYLPIVELYAFDAFKFKARNSVWNQTKYLFISELTTSGIVHLLKRTLKIQRPNNGAYTAFPSGHTSQAFVASQVLFNEYYQTHKWIGLSGYIFSGTTGALRVINNKHWVPDVLMGAGIAMLVTNLVYHFEPLKQWNPWRKSNSAVSYYFSPSISDQWVGGHLSLRF